MHKLRRDIEPEQANNHREIEMVSKDTPFPKTSVPNNLQMSSTFKP